MIIQIDILVKMAEASKKEHQLHNCESPLSSAPFLSSSQTSFLEIFVPMRNSKSSTFAPQRLFYKLAKSFQILGRDQANKAVIP